jgi:hypothetical protein
MKTLTDILEVIKHNPDKDNTIFNEIEVILNLLIKKELSFVNKLGVTTVQLRDKMKDKYPLSVMKKINNIINNDLSRGEVSENNYIELFFNVNKVWKTWGEEKF